MNKIEMCFENFAWDKSTGFVEHGVVGQTVPGKADALEERGMSVVSHEQNESNAMMEEAEFWGEREIRAHVASLEEDKEKRSGRKRLRTTAELHDDVRLVLKLSRATDLMVRRTVERKAMLARKAELTEFHQEAKLFSSPVLRATDNHRDPADSIVGFPF
uniref:Uncharacterized protein n=1 Tax=Rhodosorus marinus TaxID=101924 RepID=A0A7S2ZYQ3_9RHOD|mmetsp:Transcript_36605/g.146307  ORF Transcript_36605/g.146307 Transcript_36605/m.146307 type:complete len:160 (+) Transcript_36605:141-620(+)|eukprot:CAMPEP_0113967512 /NCGR_PEP_ID=MMETSP0011_2-20120614/8981_1 /TAXON_ID=101924 /ORGANISM="Rhodosorus marinus" /LENGTH=159 /DNA_ID=CAMNT_0000980423 /DNA_START=59 /DNA_END=538 /DNA_ORIENTATION=- /assembly_acc=CAM_ASM_000156